MRQKTVKCWPRHDGFYPKIGQKVMLVERSYDNDGDVIFELRASTEGIGGNVDGRCLRFHDWRGTTNNVSIYAHGLREIIKVVDKGQDEDGDHYFKVTVGKDLHPDWA